MSTKSKAGNPNWHKSECQRELVLRRWKRQRLAGEAETPAAVPEPMQIGEGGPPRYPDGSLNNLWRK